MNEIPRNRKKSCLIRLTAVKEHRDLTFRYHLKLEAADALSQADALGSKIGYARYVVRPKDLTARFSKLVINSKTFFKNNVEVDKWVRHRLFSKLRKTVDKENPKDITRGLAGPWDVKAELVLVSSKDGCEAEERLTTTRVNALTADDTGTGAETSWRNLSCHRWLN
ncbi:hypothetical protein ACROYT_G019296 [Oculina patagonica]